jgi:hypothetical protein
VILAGLMLRFVLVLFASLRAALYSRTDLVIEDLALRQQLAVLAHTGRRGRLTGADRLFWVTLRRVWTRWSDVLVLVKPETVIQWHRAGFRKHWTWLSRRQLTGRPSINAGLCELILRMAAENPTWGAPRIHGELRMLGIAVSERTVWFAIDHGRRRILHFDVTDRPAAAWVCPAAARGNLAVKAKLISAYVAELKALTGKVITADSAAILIRLAAGL